MTISMKRRTLLAGAGATAVAAAAGPAWSQASGKVTVGTWGGDYQALQQKHIEAPLLKPKGLEVAWDVGNDAPRKTKLLAERRLPRGTVDIVALTGPGSSEMWQAGVLEELDYSKMPNATHILPALRTKYSIPHIYTGRVILYNPAKVSPAPTSYKDLWDPKYAGKIGIIDIQYQTTIESAALINGGSLTNYEPGKAKLMELKKLGVKVLPTNEAMAQALKNEEVWMCIMWKARGVMWQNAGVPVEIAAPIEGVGVYSSELALAKNAPNKAAAYAYLNAALDPTAQAGFGESMGYNGTVDNVIMPDALLKRIGFTDAERAKLMMPDYDYLAKTDADLQEWWNKVFKGA